tara:strand:- start:100 stop:411 length:312 start_codon:yes stop_codon:yes gene_type:complete
MPFKKGESGNPKGKPKGLKSKTTEAARNILLKLLDGQIQYVENEFDLLRESNGKEYLKILATYLPYILPKQTETQVTVNEPRTEPSWFADVLEREDQKDSIDG